MNAITAQEPWQTYPVSLDEYNPLVTDGDACIKRITDLSKVLFSDEASVEVYALEEPSDGNPERLKSALRDDNAIQTCLSTNANSTIKILCEKKIGITFCGN
jgi:hypothetical protein